MPPLRRSVLLSPAARVSLNAGGSSSENLNASLSENNDEAEKKERSRNRFAEIQLSSSPRSTTESRSSFGTIGNLNAVQQAEHYTNCMKLSSENKINAKNAFQLQLIDYMAMMLKKKESELDNFQVASCTLDASTKIYAVRVDSIHSDAIKMAGGLLRNDNNRKKDDNERSDEEVDKENADGQRPKKKKTARRCGTIDANLKNLNSKEINKDCRIDPFFKRMATRFDEGQSGGCHFLGNLRILDDSQEIVLSSDITWWQTHQSVVEKPIETLAFPIPNFEAIRSSEICPSFSKFTFIGWSPDDDESIVNSEFPSQFGQDRILARDADQAFDVNAIPEDIDGMDEDMNDGLDDMGIDNDMDENTLGTVEVLGCNPQKGKKTSWGEFTDLRKVISTHPQEYSYFQKGAMIGWAGPSHWKIKPLLKRGDEAKVPGKKKARKVTMLRYESPDNEDDDFKVSEKPVCLTDATIEKWSDLKTTLPEDLHLGVSSLIRLFLKPNMAFKGNKSDAVEVEGVGQYDFDNENDRENYCTNLADDNISDDDDDDRNDCTLFPTQVGNDELSQADSGYDLVQAPNMVANIYIPYAKRAKKMDMKRLQRTIHKLLINEDSKKENIPLPQNDVQELKHMVNFSEVFHKIPEHLPSKEAQNLSFPLAFAALLHLANDKTFKITGSNDLSDLIISQDKKLCS